MTNSDIEYRLTTPTQATRVTLRAYLPGGRRADDLSPGECACTSPPSTYAAFPVKPGLVAGQIRRHGRVRLTIVFAMVNANGRETTLRRTVTVTARRRPRP